MNRIQGSLPPVATPLPAAPKPALPAADAPESVFARGDVAQIGAQPAPAPPPAPAVEKPAPQPPPVTIHGATLMPGANGTLALLEEAPTGLAAFTPEAVEAHYLTTAPNGEQTLSKAGEALYAQVRSRFMDAVPRAPHGHPTLWLTGGLPGSGKGAILDHMMKDRSAFVRVDPDAIKEPILQDLATSHPHLRSQMASDPHWGTAVHEVSSVMAKKLMGEALKSGKDIVYDSSMATANVEKYRRFAAEARRSGYKVHGVIVQVTPETAVRRALGRADRPTQVPLSDGSTLTLPGRLTSADYIHSSRVHLDRNLETYRSEDLYDNLVIYDNSRDGQPPQLIETQARK